MSDKLETFINKHLPEFDTIEPTKNMWSNIEACVEAKSVKVIKSKLLSKFIYFSLSLTLIIMTAIYFVSQKQNDESSQISHEKPKQILKEEAITTNTPKESMKEILKKDSKTAFISESQIKNNEIASVPAVSENTILPKQDTSKLKAKEKSLVDIMGVERGIFYHISYNGGPINSKKSHILGWYTHKQLPKTYFIVEHYIWNKWVNRGKVIPNSRPGRPQHSGQIIGKYAYSLKVPPHSGQNKWRVLLMDDSTNVCIGVSKELDAVDAKGVPLSLIPKVDYTIKKKTKEIIFTAETYYELHDSSGKIVDEGRATSFFYVGIEPGVYTLYYDNSIETIKLK